MPVDNRSLEIQLDGEGACALASLQSLYSLQHELSARAAAAGPRSTSRAGLAIDVLAAAPLLSATTLARAIGMSIKSGPSC